MSYDGLTKYDHEVARTYDSDRESESHWRLEYEWLASYAARRPLGRVLDVPTGTGRLFAAMGSATSIVGVDVSDAMLERARSASEAVRHCTVTLAKGNATALDYPDRSFDTVVCFRLVHLMPPSLLRALFGQLRRVSSGSVVVQVYFGSAQTPPLWRQLASRAKQLLFRSRRPWSHIHSHSHSEATIASAFAAAGLRQIDRHVLGTYEGATVAILELAA